MSSRLLAALLVVVFLAGCRTDVADPGPDPAPSTVATADPAQVSVEIAFHDASVEPQYHRSWTITADQTRMRVVADSYGEVLDDTSVATPAAAWSDFVEELPAALGELDPDEDDPGCAGGTSLTVEIAGLDGGDQVAESGSCGGRNRAVLEDLVAPLVAAAGEAL